MGTLVRVLLATLICSAVAFGHEDHDHDHGQLGMLKGENLGLFYSDHAISGHVKGSLVFAAPLENEYGIKLEHRMEGATLTSEFKKNGSAFSGKLIQLNAKGEKSEIEVAATKVNGKEGSIDGFVGTTPFTVKISSKTMNGNHYVDPTFNVMIGSKAYSFQLVGGTACIGCALKITYVVLGMLHTTGAL